MRRAVIECDTAWVTALTGRPQEEKHTAASENQHLFPNKKSHGIVVFFVFFSLSYAPEESNLRVMEVAGWLPASLCTSGSSASESCRTALIPPASVGLKLCTLQLTRDESQLDYSSILKTHSDSCKLGI